MILKMLTILSGAWFSMTSADICPGPEQPVDYRQIQEIVRTTDVYKRTLEKLEENPFSLFPEDYRVLYYGFAFTPHYHGSFGNGEMELGLLLQEGNYHEALDRALEIIDINPASLEALKVIILTGSIMEEEDCPADLSIIRYHFQNLMETVTSSGDGTRDRPYKVIRVEDEYILLEYLGIPPNRKGLYESKYDVYLHDDPRTGQQTEVFFDISLSMLHLRSVREGYKDGIRLPEPEDNEPREHKTGRKKKDRNK